MDRGKTATNLRAGQSELARLLDELSECERRRDAVYSVRLSEELDHRDENFAEVVAEGQRQWRLLNEQCRRIQEKIAMLTQDE